MPLHPTYRTIKTEPTAAGFVAMATNGVPIFGAKEAIGGNAMEPDDSNSTSVWDARFWYGHATVDHIQHYHSPNAGISEKTPAHETLIGYALDGFPLYGPMEDDSSLDECNGRFVSGSYQYHVRTLDQVDETLDYCKGDDDPAVNWNYILGCYHGDVYDTTMVADASPDSLTTEIPSDCVEVVAPTPAPKTRTKPNVIIIQPDDLPFYKDWTPPPNNPIDPDKETAVPENFTMPNMERLRRQGVQMMQAYTTSPACGTSRFSTITGKYPSRSAYSRSKSSNNGARNFTSAKVSIPRTKLEDIEGYGNDCKDDNIVAAMANAGYRTGVVGKWHLSKVNTSYDFSYDEYRETVKSCGFDFAEALYAENLDNDHTQGVDLDVDDQQFTHNMEWVTHEAVNFIHTSANADEPFLLYFNPTVPHSAGSVEEAFTESRYNCTVTSDLDNWLPEDPMIKGMTLEYGTCADYRDYVVRRAGGPHNSNENLGVVWLDDSIGALIHALVDQGIFEDTIIIFQMDHGIEGKQTLYENGNRIAQFVHYPDAFGTDGKQFHGLVSTIDIAPTLFDYAGITSHYQLDGQSWKDAIGNDAEEQSWQDERCLFFENQFDRAVRCGCNKLVRMKDENTGISRPDGATMAPSAAPSAVADQAIISNSYTLGKAFGYPDAHAQLHDLCDATTGDLISYPSKNPERLNLYDSATPPNAIQVMFREVMECFRTATQADLEPDFAADCSSLYSTALVHSTRCQTDTECSGGEICDHSILACVECIAAMNCAAPNGHCLNNKCSVVECTGGNDCTDPTKPYCSTGGNCVQCRTDGHCAAGGKCQANVCGRRRLRSGNDEV